MYNCYTKKFRIMIRIKKSLNNLSDCSNRKDLSKSFVDSAFLVYKDGCKFKVLSIVRKTKIFEIFNT